MSTDRPELARRLSRHVDRAGAPAADATPARSFEVEEREIRGVRIKTWKNAPPTLAEVFAVERVRSATRTYMVNDDERVTFDAHRAGGRAARARA